VNAEELLAGIRDANYHHGGIRCLRLLRVHEGALARVRDEVERYRAAEPASDATRPEHVTNWTRPFGRVLQYSLLNRSGRSDDFSSDHDLSCFGKRFHGAADYPELARFVAAFPHAVNFRIHAMEPRSGLSTHEEHTMIRTSLGTVGVRARFHLPVTTNPAAELMLDGDVYHLEVGSVFFVNNGCVHRARNDGEETRTHLVWDQLLTQETLKLMFGEGQLTPLRVERVPPTERALVPLRRERIGHVRRLPPPVAEDEAVAAQLMIPQ
jgi:hypothetical protein